MSPPCASSDRVCSTTISDGMDFITTEPSKFAAQFHNRMPLILEPDTWDLWMTGEPDAAAVLMKPANEDVLVSRPVSK